VQVPFGQLISSAAQVGQVGHGAASAQWLQLGQPQLAAISHVGGRAEFTGRKRLLVGAGAGLTIGAPVVLTRPVGGAGKLTGRLRYLPQPQMRTLSLDSPPSGARMPAWSMSISSVIVMISRVSRASTSNARVPSRARHSLRIRHFCGGSPTTM
jgi:hypothetical protein